MTVEHEDRGLDAAKKYGAKSTLAQVGRTRSPVVICFAKTLLTASPLVWRIRFKLLFTRYRCSVYVIGFSFWFRVFRQFFFLVFPSTAIRDMKLSPGGLLSREIGTFSVCVRRAMLRSA